jgi:hypothetical protein
MTVYCEDPTVVAWETEVKCSSEEEMKKGDVKLSQVKNIPTLIYKATYDEHMRFGDKKGGVHSGLHLIGEFTDNATGRALKASDIVKDRVYAGRLNDRATTVTITEVDLRAQTFKASVDIYGTAKISTFFPVGTTLALAKKYSEEAWKDHCTYGSSDYGGGDVDIYKQLRKAFGLNWVGMAKIGTQEIWVGSEHSGSVEASFPAVNNKFGQ